MVIAANTIFPSMHDSRNVCPQTGGGGGGQLTASAALGVASVLLQVPRALALRNRMFFTGTSFCSVAGLLALLPNPHPLMALASLPAAALLLAWAALSQFRRALSDRANSHRR